MSQRIEQIIKKFPQLAGKEEFIGGIIEIREAFKLEKVPFSVSIGDWCSGSLESFYEAERDERFLKRESLIKAMRKKNGRKRNGSPGLKIY